MRLAAAANYFDQQTLTDAYGTATLQGQLDLFDDSKRDGAITRRRILSVAPGTVIPARNALSLGDQAWIVGGGNPDYFKGTEIRRKYILHRSDGLASIQTFGQLLSAGGTTAHMALEWVKTGKEVNESSDVLDVLTAILARTEAVPSVGIATLGGVSYLLREAHLSAAGFQIVYADEIKGPAIEQGSFMGRTYDAVNDVWTGAGTAVNFLRLRWQTHFRYLSTRTLNFQPGDDMLICLKSAAAPKANDRITLSDGIRQVLTVQSEDTSCWNIHARLIPG